MKKPSQELVDAFLKWYSSDPHSNNEDYYSKTITKNHLAGLSKSAFIEFFYQFAHEGGKVQSGGTRTSGRFRETIETNYNQFRQFVLNPFETNFDVEKWLTETKNYKYFGIGLATIYLNRVDKKRFPILNNKSADSLELFGISLPSDTVKRYNALLQAQQQLINWFPQFDNFYHADSLNQFLIGEDAGEPWIDILEEMPPNSTEQSSGIELPSIWKISHGKVDFSTEQRKNYLEQRTVHVHKDTKKGQGKLFSSKMKAGDLFYLCHGNDDGIQVLGRITGPATPSPHDDGWLQRKYDILFKSIKASEKYMGIKKGWTPNYNSTCMAVPKEEINLFESEILLPFFGKQLKDIPGFVERPFPPISLPSRNIILYGPPGTGKTYALRNDYMKYFTESEVVTRDQFAREIAGELTWLQVITIVLYDLGSAKVPTIFDHSLLKAKIRLQANQNPKNTIWSWLQRHTKMDCPNVKHAQRDEPLIFSKDENSIWTVDREMVDEQFPELVTKLTKFQEFKPISKKIRRFEYVTFHQSYCYEDFVEGIKPVMSEDMAETLAYEIKPGIFKRMVQLALDDPDHNYALLIDEINRGNVASIFGELISLIEEDKRKGESNELRAQLPYSRQEFVIPENLYIIGAMNTADRNVESLDTALRRRFTFVAIPPQPELIQQPGNLEVNLQNLLIKINARIEKLLDKDHCIGHSYFMSIAKANDPLRELCSIFSAKILPLLEEHFYGDPGKIGMVLGEQFITRTDETIEWAAGDWGVDEFEERRVYSIQDPKTLKVEDYRAIYE